MSVSDRRQHCQLRADSGVSAGSSANEVADPTLTENSQPGELAEFHGRPWRQRAFITAFVADPELASALAAQAAEAHSVVRAYPPGRHAGENGERDAVGVTFWEGHGVMTGMGNWQPCP
ncbi:DUF6919 domain-containing protein [Streptomyces sp. NPDC093591]|uniref:DUF6919 domain-containing protein n=1 Tax=Streptomyces sp. NPDC093591 TaxID=3366044 RepID=UPI003813AAE2